MLTFRFTKIGTIYIYHEGHEDHEEIRFVNFAFYVDNYLALTPWAA